MEPNSLPALPFSRDGYVRGLGRRPRFSKHAPQPGRTCVAEHRSVTVRKSSSHPAAFIAQAGVANGVDTAMDAVQAAGASTVADGTRRKAGGVQLLHRDHAVLPSGEAGDRGVPSSAWKFLRHIRNKFPVPPISPPSVPLFARRRGP